MKSGSTLPQAQINFKLNIAVKAKKLPFSKKVHLVIRRVGTPDELKGLEKMGIASTEINSHISLSLETPVKS
ncbi:hypothetical protein SAMN03159341_11639 [Paenibacillus sp. 1_12]|nr:hypothetical protein SAMN03159341_11639 [Paenibacillus sp. 1_12]